MMTLVDGIQSKTNKRKNYNSKQNATIKNGDVCFAWSQKQPTNVNQIYSNRLSLDTFSRFQLNAKKNLMIT